MAELLLSALTEEGHAVTTAADGKIALELGKTGQFDVIVLDIMLPGLNGMELTRRWREAGVRTPVLILTARDAAADIVGALDCGADDYLTKPFSLEVLLARIRAVSRRGQITQPVRLELGGLILDTDTRDVTRDGRRIFLSPREYSLLELLMRNRGRVVTRDRIIESVWGFLSDIEENTLDAYIRLLRNKVDIGDEARLIQTVRGVGYCLREGPA